MLSTSCFRFLVHTHLRTRTQNVTLETIEHLTRRLEDFRITMTEYRAESHIETRQRDLPDDFKPTDVIQLMDVLTTENADRWFAHFEATIQGLKAW